MQRLSGEPASPTRILILANVLMYIGTSIASGNFLETSEYVLRTVGQANYLVLHGAVWQLFTSNFVHVNLAHLFGNMIFLAIFGMGAETLFNRKQYFIIYLASGLFGSILSLLTGINSVSAGASGAIFGLFGAVTIYSEGLDARSIFMALFYSTYFLALNIGVNVNVYAHAGGLIIGLLLGYYYAKNTPKENRYLT
jgi:rhomboid protease GluP